VKIVQGYPVPGNWRKPLEDEENDKDGGKAPPKE